MKLHAIVWIWLVALGITYRPWGTVLLIFMLAMELGVWLYWDNERKYG